MTTKFLITIFSLCLIKNAFSMEKAPLITAGLNTSLTENFTEKTILTAGCPLLEKWHWFITYLNLTINTKKITYKISKFDPAVRIYDGDTHELIMTLQRITNEGENTSSPSKDVSIEGYRFQDNSMCLLIKDKQKTILSFDVGGKENMITSYDTQEQPDLEIRTKQLVKIKGGLIRLSPSYIYSGIDYEKFFKEFNETKE